MAGLWMAVMLVFLLSDGGSAAVDQNKLRRLIQDLTKEYQISGMFCLALSIQSEDSSNLVQIFKDNLKETVEKELSQGLVYKGKRLVVAAVKTPEHAEYRVLKDLKMDSNEGDLLVIYSNASSCPTTCTNKSNHYNILSLVSNAVNKWSKHAFVFKKIFKPHGSDGFDKSTLEKALTELGKSGIGLENIFRCYKPTNSAFHCASCSTKGEVTDECVDYNAKK